MNGKIYFTNLKDLADFLKAFAGSTATFDVHQIHGDWILEFKGGY